MAIRLTREAKAYLERMFVEELKWVRLTMLPVPLKKGKMSYSITWTDRIYPDRELSRTACDRNVIVIERKYAHLLDGVLLGLDANDPTKVVIIENPNVLMQEDGKLIARYE